MIPEDILALLFTKRQVQKIKVIYLLKEKQVSLELLQATLQTNVRNTKLLMAEWLAEINALLDQAQATIRLTFANGLYFFEGEAIEAQLASLMEEVTYQFAKESPVYTLLLWTLEKRQFYMADVVQLLAYSESHSYKIVDQLVQLLNHLALDIRLVKETGTRYTLLGEEGTLRWLHYFSILRVFRREKWPFHNIRRAEMVSMQKYFNSATYTKLSLNNQTRLNYISAIYENALKTNHRLAPLPPEVLEIGNLATAEGKSLYLAFFLENQLHPSADFESELIHLAFLTNYQIQELRSKTEKITIGREICQLKENRIMQAILAFAQQLQAQFGSLPEEEYYLMIYGLCGRVVTIHYLNLAQFTTFQAIPTFRGDLEEQLGELIEQTFADYRAFASFASLKSHLLQYVISFIAFQWPLQQRIYLEFYYKPEYKSILEKFLHKVYDAQLIQVVDDYRLADIIVSDVRPLETDQPYFYMYNIFNRQQWHELGRFINQRVNQQLVTEAKLTDW